MQVPGLPHAAKTSANDGNCGSTSFNWKKCSARWGCESFGANIFISNLSLCPPIAVWGSCFLCCTRRFSSSHTVCCLAGAASWGSCCRRCCCYVWHRAGKEAPAREFHRNAKTTAMWGNGGDLRTVLESRSKTITGVLWHTRTKIYIQTPKRRQGTKSQKNRISDWGFCK